MEPRQYEIIKGEKYNMSPVGYSHSKAEKKLKPLLDSLITLKKLDSEFESAWDTWTIAKDGNKIAPDYAVYKAPISRDGETITDIPIFVMEVLSPSTRAKDLTVKKDLYGNLGVSEYWIVDPISKFIDVYKTTAAGSLDRVGIYQMFDKNEWDYMTDEDKAEHQQVIHIDFINMDVDIKDLF